MSFILGLVGFVGNGKGTVGDILKDRFDFIQDSFAASLKDCVSIMFGWNRKLLEGDTDESRKFRESVDPYWSEKMAYQVTPRIVLQKFGTDAVRNGLHEGMWVDSLEKRLHPTLPTVITDVRFPNEIEMIRRKGGYIVWVRKQELPEWYEVAYNQNITNKNDLWELEDQMNLMEIRYPTIHQSEWPWIGEQVDFEVHNDGTLQDLNNAVDELITESYIEEHFRLGVI